MGKSTNNGGKVYETRCKVCGKNIALIYTEMYTYRRQYKGKTEYYAAGHVCSKQIGSTSKEAGYLKSARNIIGYAAPT